MLSIHRQYTKSWLVFCPLKCIFSSSFYGETFLIKTRTRRKRGGGQSRRVTTRFSSPTGPSLSNKRGCKSHSLSPPRLTCGQHLTNGSPSRPNWKMSLHLPWPFLLFSVCVSNKRARHSGRAYLERKREKKTISQHCFNTWMYPPHVLVCYAAASL